jgi:hypothetical protein
MKQEGLVIVCMAFISPTFLTMKVAAERTRICAFVTDRLRNIHLGDPATVKT